MNWVESVIRRHGGRIQGANLGSALAGDNVALYRSVKSELVSRFALFLAFVRVSNRSALVVVAVSRSCQRGATRMLTSTTALFALR